MKILVIGRIPSAHFISKLLAKSNTVYHYGANITYQVEDNYIPLPAKESLDYLIGCIKKLNFDLIIPTQLEYQLSEELREAIKDTPCFMPSHNNALLEWDKSKTKDMLNELNIPTPKHQVLSKEELIECFFIIQRPFVLKYNKYWNEGLQTVIVTDTNQLDEYDRMKDSPVETFIIDEFIDSKHEISYHAICNDTNWKYLGSARDYKKFENDDKGFNTEGVGSYSITDRFYIVDQYVDKILNYLSQQGDPYVGILYLGIIFDKDNVPLVLEINTRFGCPESLSIISTVTNELGTLLYSATMGLVLPEITFSDDKAVTVVVSPKDYKYDPNSEKPEFINVPKDITYTRPGYSSSYVFTSKGFTISQASDKIYAYLKTQKMGEYVYRTDIGYLK